MTGQNAPAHWTNLDVSFLSQEAQVLNLYINIAWTDRSMFSLPSLFNGLQPFSEGAVWNIWQCLSDLETQILPKLNESLFLIYLSCF